VTTDICLSPQYDWYIALSKISILGFQPLPIQKIFPWAKKSRDNEKNQRSEGLWTGSLLLCLSLTRANLTLSPGSAFTRNLMNLGTNGRRNNIDCARPNEALEVAEKAPRTVFTHENKLQYRPGKETHNPEQKRSCFLRQRNSVITTVFIFLSSFCLNLRRLISTRRCKLLHRNFLCFRLACWIWRGGSKGQTLVKNRNEKQKINFLFF